MPKAPSTINTSLFDNSQQKLINSSIDSCPELIESPELTNSPSNFHINNNNNNERLKVGKADSIETDEGDDEDELHVTFDLNESNLSSKPLHANNWNYRQPIVGPNG